MPGLKHLLHQGDISNLSYFFAEFIAQQSSVDIDHPVAISAALISEKNQQGDVCVDLKDYVDQPLFNSDVKNSPIVVNHSLESWIHLLQENHCVGKPGEFCPLILEESRLYLNRFYFYESNIESAILSRQTLMPTIDQTQVMQSIQTLFPGQMNQTELSEQLLAVMLAVIRPFTVISGGPGTGKTTTVIKILACLLSQQPNIRIKLAAPTGKAAARMVESIRLGSQRLTLDESIQDLLPQEASTLHRLLGYRNHRFRYDRDHLIPVDCLIIDEASMVDISLMSHLLDAIPANARIILLGDRDQLASVSAGNVLGDITGHGQSISYSSSQAKQLNLLSNGALNIPANMGQQTLMTDSIALLTKSYRFRADSGIGTLANRVNRGDAQSISDCLNSPQDDLKWHQTNELDQAMMNILVEAYRLVVQGDDVITAITALEKIRILCAVHTGPAGTEHINETVSQKMYALGWIDNIEQFTGMPIMITTNDYDSNLFNGDTGLFWPNEKGVLSAYFRGEDQEIRQYPIHSLPRHVPAWAMTVHKAQGSEFDSIYLVLPNSGESGFVTRELLYTAITRAREHLTIIAPIEQLMQACQRLTRRSSGLAQKLGWKASSS